MKQPSRKQYFLSDIERDLLRHALKSLKNRIFHECDNNNTQKTCGSFVTARIDALYGRLQDGEENEQC